MLSLTTLGVIVFKESEFSKSNKKNFKRKALHTYTSLQDQNDHSIFVQKHHSVIFYQNLPVLLKRKPYLRAIRLQIIPCQTIICYANQKTSISDIMNFLSTHDKWIHKQLNKLQNLADQYPHIYWNSHTQVPFLGEFKPLKIISGKPKQLRVQEDHIEVHLPHFKVSQTEWSELFKQHYKKLSIRVLKCRLDKWSDQMQLHPQKVIFKKQKSQWGSCSTTGSLSLNWKLIVAPLAVIDYVIIHELSHLKYPNHSVAFWTFVNTYFQRTQECRRWLKRNQYAFDFLEDRPELHASDIQLPFS